jgi:hypothetical protein
VGAHFGELLHVATENCTCRISRVDRRICGIGRESETMAGLAQPAHLDRVRTANNSNLNPICVIANGSRTGSQVRASPCATFSQEEYAVGREETPRDILELVDAWDVRSRRRTASPTSLVIQDRLARRFSDAAHFLMRWKPLARDKCVEILLRQVGNCG